MDALTRHMEGRRGSGRVCPCCSMTGDKREDTRLARTRLARETRREVYDALTDGGH